MRAFFHSLFAVYICCLFLLFNSGEAQNGLYKQKEEPNRINPLISDRVNLNTLDQDILQTIVEDFQVNEHVGRGKHMEPAIATDNFGNTIVVWPDERNTQWDIYCRRYDTNGIPQGSDFKVNGEIVARDPDVDVDGHGNFIIVWESSGVGIAWRYFDASGQPQGGIIKANDDAGHYTWFNPSIAVNTSGEFIIAWQDKRNGNDDIFYQHYDSNHVALGGNVMVNDDEGTANQWFPSVALSDSGSFAVVWEDKRDDSRQDIYCQLYDTSGVPVGGNFKVNDDGVQAYQTDCDIGMDTMGNFTITWEDDRFKLFDDNIFCQRYTFNGTALGNNFKVNDDGNPEGHKSPTLSMNNHGAFVIVWYDSRDNDWNIYGQRYNSSGTAQSSNFKINDDNLDIYQSHPEVALSAIGTFTVVWQDKRLNAHNDIFAQRFSSSGASLGSNYMVNDDEGRSYQYDARIGVAANGNFVISWMDQRFTFLDEFFGVDIFRQRYSSLGTPLGSNAMVIITDNSRNWEPESHSFGMDGMGNHMVVWADDDAIFFQRYNSGGSVWGGNIRVDDYPRDWVWETHQFEPSVDMNDNGQYVIVWRDNQDEGGGIYYQRYNSSGTALGGNVLVTQADGTRAHQNHTVAVGNDGSFIVVWEDRPAGGSSSTWDIYGQRFNSIGQPMGSTFTVNDDAGTYTQSYPAVTIGDLGHFVIAWKDKRNEYKGDIYCQLYDPDGVAIGSNLMVNDDDVNHDQSYPAVAMYTNNYFVIAWEDKRNGSWDIYAQRFDSTGTPICGNFRIDNDGSGRDQRQPVIGIANSMLVSSWEDNRQPEQGWDVFANMIDLASLPTICTSNESPQVTSPILDIMVDEDEPDWIAADLDIVFYDADEDPLTFAAQWDTSALQVYIDTEHRVNLSLVPDWNGSTEITVTAADSEYTAADQFQLIVNPVNDRPVILQPLADLVLNEDQPDMIIANISGMFFDIDEDPLDYSHTVSDTHVTLIIDNGNNIHVSLAPDWFGQASAAVHADDGEYTASDTFNITVNPLNHNPSDPIIVHPDKGSELLPGADLSWTHSIDADMTDIVNYHIQLDNSSNFLSPEIDQTDISSNGPLKISPNVWRSVFPNTIESVFSITPEDLTDYESLVDNTVYFWRVRAMDNQNGYSNWTDGTHYFFFNKENNMPLPPLTGFQPSDSVEITNPAPLLSWNPALDPDLSDSTTTLAYMIQISGTLSFDNPVFTYQTGQGTTSIQANTLNDNAIHFYRIRAEDDEGLFSNWSDIQAFIVNMEPESPNAFNMISPSNGTVDTLGTGNTVKYIQFLWENAADPDFGDTVQNYTLMLTQDSVLLGGYSSLDTSQVNMFHIGPDTTVIIELGSGDHFWRVAAVDKQSLYRIVPDTLQPPWKFTLLNFMDIINPENLPKAYALYQNYPNPFNPVTQIGYSLPKTTLVYIEVFDILGHRVDRLLNERKSAGHYVLEYDASHLPSGTYVYRLKTDDFQKIGKMLLLK